MREWGYPLVFATNIRNLRVWDGYEYGYSDEDEGGDEFHEYDKDEYRYHIRNSSHCQV